MPTHEELFQAKLQRIKESHRVERGRTALMVIDMQHGFLDDGASLALPNATALIPGIQRLIAASRASGIPVIFTEYVYATNVPCLRGDPFGPEHLAAQSGEPPGFGYPSNNCLIGLGAADGVESATTVEALAPEPGELVIQGHTYDKFYGTPLDLSLRSQNIDRLIFTGITTDVCVNCTLMTAANLNYRAIAVGECMAAIHDHIHDACLQIWQNKFARLASTAEVIDEIASLAA
jgi:nicotinamidase-related amidase